MLSIATQRGRWTFAVTFMVSLAMVLTLPVMAGAAKPKVVAIEGVDYNVNASLRANLEALKGKRVYLTLTSGKTVSGRVGPVGEHLVHIEKLVGKEYFDALVRLKDISAIDTMFRKLQR